MGAGGNTPGGGWFDGAAPNGFAATPNGFAEGGNSGFAEGGKATVLPSPTGGAGGALLGGDGGAGGALLSEGGGGGGTASMPEPDVPLASVGVGGGGGLLRPGAGGGGGGGRLLTEDTSNGLGAGGPGGSGGGAATALGGGGGAAPRDTGGTEGRLGAGKPGLLRPAPLIGLARPNSVFWRGDELGAPLGRDFFARPSNTSKSDPPLSLMSGLLSPSRHGLDGQLRYHSTSGGGLPSSAGSFAAFRQVDVQRVALGLCTASGLCMDQCPPKLHLSKIMSKIGMSQIQ